MFIDARKAHLNAKCDEKEWVVAWVVLGVWKVREAAEMALRNEESGRRMGGGLRGEVGGRRISERQRSAHGVFQREDGSKARGARRRDDFTYSGTKKELEKMKGKMEEWYGIKDRGTMGQQERDQGGDDPGAHGEMDCGGPGVRGGRGA